MILICRGHLPTQMCLLFHENMMQAFQPRRSNRLHLDDIHDVDSIEDLSIKQLKEILVNNFVNFRGCCEKWELTDRVKRLWQAKQLNKEKGEFAVTLHWEINASCLCEV